MAPSGVANKATAAAGHLDVSFRDVNIFNILSMIAKPWRLS